MSATPITTLLAELVRLGITLEADGDRLRYWPRSVMTPQLAARVRQHKEALLRILKSDSPTQAVRLATHAERATEHFLANCVPTPDGQGWYDPSSLQDETGQAYLAFREEQQLAGARGRALPEPWRERFEERAAVMEHEGQLSRSEAENQALTETLAEMKLASHASDGKKIAKPQATKSGPRSCAAQQTSQTNPTDPVYQQPKE